MGHVNFSSLLQHHLVVSSTTEDLEQPTALVLHLPGSWSRSKLAHAGVHSLSTLEDFEMFYILVILPHV